MKITRNTPQQLIIENKPWVIALGLTLGGLIFLAVGLFILSTGEFFGLLFAAFSLLPFGLLFVFVKRLQILFLRETGTVVIRRRSLTSMREVTHELSEITRADVQSTTSSEGRPMGRVVLVLESGQSAGVHPLTNAYDNYTDHPGIARSINTWLDEARSA